MLKSVSHDRAEETMEAKVRWFQTLSVEERLEYLCALAELALAVRPHLMEPLEPADAAPADPRLTHRRPMRPAARPGGWPTTPSERHAGARGSPRQQAVL